MSMPIGTIRKTHCKRGHERTPDNVHKNGMCKICQKERLAIYHKEHPEKQRAISARHREEHPEKARAKVAKWREANREKERESARASYAANPGYYVEKRRKYRESHGEAHNQKTAEWKAANKDKVRGHNHKRRALVVGATVEPFSVSDIYDRDQWICGICSRPVDSGLRFPEPLSASLDHVVPLAKGGAHSPANVQLAHLRCNMSKGDRYPAVV